MMGNFKKKIRKDIKIIKKDLKYHILRTDLLEKTVNSVWWKGALALAFAGGAFSAIKSLVALF